MIAVGYVQDGAAEGPFFANLGLTPIPDDPPDHSESWQVLGEVAIEDSGLGGYLANRVSIEFEVPAGLSPGEYMVAVRNADDEFFGDLIGLTLAVGFDPEFERWIEWPLDEPLIAELPADDVIAGPGWSVTVADLRDEQYPPEAAEFMLEPDSLPPPTVVEQTIAETTTTVAPTTTTSVVQTSTTVVETSTLPQAEAERVELQSSTDIASRALAPVNDSGMNQSPVTIMVLAVGVVAVVGITWRAYSVMRSGSRDP